MLQSVNLKLTIVGTDHPFFPPLEEDAKEWHSVNANYGAISKAFSTIAQSLCPIHLFSSVPVLLIP